MKMSEQRFEGAQPPIDGYAPGGFRIGGRFREGAILLSPAGLRAWAASEIAALDADAARALGLADAVDVLLLGTGPDIAPAPDAFAAALHEQGVGVEPMATATACRSYNVLLGEGRRVAAALLPV